MVFLIPQLYFMESHRLCITTIHGRTYRIPSLCAVGFRTCFSMITLIFEVRLVVFLRPLTYRSVFQLMWSTSCSPQIISCLLTRFLVSVSFSFWLQFWPNQCYFPVFEFFIGFWEFSFCWIQTAFLVEPVYFDFSPNWPSWSTQVG